MRSFQGGLERAWASGCIRSSYVVLRPSKEVHPPFFAHLFKSAAYIQALQATSNFIRDGQDLNFNNFTMVNLPLVPLEEQRAIADFLDRRTAAIDDLIDRKQKALRLLAAQRAAVINEAVTGQDLDVGHRLFTHGMNARPRDTSWKIGKFQWEIDFQEGPGILAKDFSEGGVPLLRISSIQSDPASLEGCNWLREDDVAARWAHMRVRQGDIVISGSASTDVVSEIGGEAEGAILYTGLIRLRPRRNQLTRGYIKLWVQSQAFQDQVSLLKAGATIQHFGPTHLRQTFVLVPPIQYQQQAVEAVDMALGKLAKCMETIRLQVQCLREYRKALVTNAVTGQFELPAMRDPEHILEAQA